MKLFKCTHIEGYIFHLVFVNRVEGNINIEELLQGKVSESDLPNFSIDADWGCLEWNNVEIEPKSLYRYFQSHQESVTCFSANNCSKTDPKMNCNRLDKI